MYYDSAYVTAILFYVPLTRLLMPIFCNKYHFICVLTKNAFSYNGKVYSVANLLDTSNQSWCNTGINSTFMKVIMSRFCWKCFRAVLILMCGLKKPHVSNISCTNISIYGLDKILETQILTQTTSSKMNMKLNQCLPKTVSIQTATFVEVDLLTVLTRCTR